MGWKQFFHKTFKENWDAGEPWGDLELYKITLDGQDYYCAGHASLTPTDWLYSPKVQHPQGVRTRITVRYIFWCSAGVTGKAGIGIIFFKDGDSCKDPDGYDIHGVSTIVLEPPAENLADTKEFVVEYDGTNKITLYSDGSKVADVILEVPLVSFKVAIKIEEASGGGDIGILIYEVIGEYYDQWEDLINQIYGIMQWMIPLMLVMMIIPAIVGIFKGKKKTEEEGKVIVIPG